MGASIAQKLAGEGHEVTLVTQAERDRRLHGIHARGARCFTATCTASACDMHAYTMLERIEPGVCHAYNVWDPDHKETFEVDSVVLCTGAALKR